MMEEIIKLAEGTAQLPSGAVRLHPEAYWVKPEFFSEELPYDGLDVCVVKLKDHPELPITVGQIAPIGENRLVFA